MRVVSLDKSPPKIASMFDKVASHYDFMNDLMTGFSHKLTRTFALRMSGFTSGMKALDLATGTGDFAFLLDRQAGGDAEIVGIDISRKMLAVATERARRKGVGDSVRFMHGDIQDLPFEDDSFDVCTIGYGIRNVPDARSAMQEILRVTKPGGRFLIVEATPPVNRHLRFLANFHFSKLIPTVAKLLMLNADAYEYFARSVDAFPIAPRFARIMEEVGWKVRYYPMFFGTVTVFAGVK